jgi:peptidoglycan/LPS O-acetylase OafA/YrhL
MALRGAGALFVVTVHLWPHDFFSYWTRVDLFFVLTGYFTTYTLFAGTKVRDFYLSRFSKLIPTYYAALAVFLSHEVLRGDAALGDISYLFFLQYTSLGPLDFRRGENPMFGHTWTLAVQAQFYIVWPLAVNLLPGRTLLPITILLAAAPPLLRSRCDRTRIAKLAD